MTDNESLQFIKDVLEKYFDSFTEWLSKRPPAVESLKEMFRDIDAVDAEVAARRIAMGREEKPRMFDDYALAIRQVARSLYMDRTIEAKRDSPFPHSSKPAYNISELVREAIKIKAEGGDISSILPVVADEDTPRYDCIDCMDMKRVRCWHVRSMRFMRKCIAKDEEFTGYDSRLTCMVVCSCSAADLIAQVRHNERSWPRYNPDHWVRIEHDVRHADDIATLREWAENYQEPGRKSSAVDEWDSSDF